MLPFIPSNITLQFLLERQGFILVLRCFMIKIYLERGFVMRGYGRDSAKLSDGSLVYMDTGELIVEHGIFKTFKQINSQKKYYCERGRKIKLQKEIKDYEKIKGEFIWIYFKEQEELFPDLKHQDITKLIYIATYCQFKTNILIMNNRIMRKNDMLNCLNIGKTIFYEWFDKMRLYGYFEVIDDEIKINNNFFSKGKMLKNKNSSRIFVDTIRTIYNNMTSKDHYKLGYIFQLIPYMNPTFNALVKKQKEKDINLLKRLTVVTIANILKIERVHYIRLKKYLLSMYFGENKECIMRSLSLKELYVEKIMVINPKLFFSGNLSEYNKICESFKNEALERIEEG